MVQNLTFLSLIQLVLSIFMGVFFMWLTYKVFLRWFGKQYKLLDLNLAVAILLAGVLFSTGYIISGTLSPLLNTLRIISRNNPSIGSLLLDSSRYLAEFLSLGFMVALLVNYMAIALFNALTPEKDELKEISENQVQYSIILAAILVVMALFAREAYISLLDSLVPFNPLPTIF